jgi:hypothetical protein
MSVLYIVNAKVDNEYTMTNYMTDLTVIQVVQNITLRHYLTIKRLTVKFKSFIAKVK